MNFYRFKDKIPLCLRSNIVYKFACGRCCATYYNESCGHFKVRVGEHSGVSPLTSSNSEFHLKIKESLLILLDQPILNKNEASLLLYLFD